MARWRTLNRRQRRRLHGPTLPRADFKRLSLCNRFAASFEGRSMVVGYESTYGRVFFPDAFYLLKDRILHRYGRHKGYTLQHWTSYAHDYGDYDGGMKDGCHHYHILERTRLRGFVFHKPTGHFYWCNDLSEDYKETDGFREARARCVEAIEGKKRITRAVPDKSEAFHALKHLNRRYARLPEPPKEPKPRVRAGNWYGEMMSRHLEAERQKEAARQTQCHWCLEPKLGLEVTKHAGHEFCMKCLPKAMRKWPEHEAEEIPF